MKLFYPSLWVAIALTSLHVLFSPLISSSIDLFQVILGCPLRLAPCRFQSSACFSTAPSVFLSVWPIHLHFLVFICISISFCLVCSHRSSFDIVSGHLICRILLNHLLIKVCILLLFALLSMFHRHTTGWILHLSYSSPHWLRW